MPSDAIYSRLTDIMRDVFEDDELVATPDLTADDVDGWDSLSHLRLVMTVQKAFAVKFSAGEIGKMKRLGDMAELIAAKAA